MSGGMQAQTPPQQQRQQRQQRPQQRSRSGRELLRPVTVDDIAAEDVMTVERDTPVPTAVASMAENDVGSVVVVEDDEPIGMLTDRKVALALEDTPEVAQRTVGDLVSEELVTADSSTTVFDVVKMMGENGIRRIPIVDEENTLQGIVTLDDVIVLLGTELGNVTETIQAQIDRL
jgi:CBS domain-containing protein